MMEQGGDSLKDNSYEEERLGKGDITKTGFFLTLTVSFFQKNLGQTIFTRKTEV